MGSDSAGSVQVFGLTDRGRLRDVNEDRCHIDAARGLLIVVDGVGGHLAGGKAADVGVSRVREWLERRRRVTASDVRDAITAANNEIHQLAASRAEWHGMACVLTVAVVRAGQAIVGHVGDTRLYKIRAGAIQKLTRDHSPVGEMEDAQRLTEDQAMRHPRRNEVYRDVGSDHHDRDDREFIDLLEVPFEPDAALLMCSDGLTDLVPLQSIADTVSANAGSTQGVVRALIDAANAAGGRDNVTVVYAEGPRFVGSRGVPIAGPQAVTGGDADADAITTQLSIAGTGGSRPRPAAGAGAAGPIWLPLIVGALLIAMAALSVRGDAAMPAPAVAANPDARPALTGEAPIVVSPGASIGEALERASAGSTVSVEPGEYREEIRLKSHVRLLSRVPRGATLRLPAETRPGEPAVSALGVTGAELAGFRIVGDAATPLGIGILVGWSSVSISDVEIAGATAAAIEFGEKADASLVGSSLRDNPGVALAMRDRSAPRISNNTFERNGYGAATAGAFVLAHSARPVLRGNVFVGTAVHAFAALPAAERTALERHNWFLPAARRGPR